MIFEYFNVFVLAIMPISEIRGALIYSAIKNLNIFLSFFISIISSLFVIIIFINLFEKVFLFLKNHSRFFLNLDKFIEKFIEAKKIKYKEKIELFEELFLLIFTAIPLPFTGFYTASLLAVIFKLNKLKSIFYITLGNIIAGTILITITKIWQ